MSKPTTKQVRDQLLALLNAFYIELSSNPSVNKKTKLHYHRRDGTGGVNKAQLLADELYGTLSTYLCVNSNECDLYEKTGE